MKNKFYLDSDLDLANAISKEMDRQDENIELIASENFVSNDILKVSGSVLTNKYAEGYPNKRYYSGCENVDVVENIAIERAKKLFNCKYANVQPHSGSQANAAAYAALIKPGDKILGMSLEAGGHLTHGYNISFSGITYQGNSYGVDENGFINYENVLAIAEKVKPNLIIAGASSYSRIIDWSKFREIANKVGAKLVVDMAHIAGLVATGLHPSPIPFADIVTSTTHKTLRGARGGLILANDLEIGKLIDKSVFPGQQGGPLMHQIAGKALCFREALDPTFKTYIENVVKNSQAFADEFTKLGIPVITNGTDNHLFMINVKESLNVTGKFAADLLDSIGVTVNKNTIPCETESPFITSGLRLGTAAMTTKGFGESDFRQIANIIVNALKNSQDNDVKTKLREEVLQLTSKAKKMHQFGSRTSTKSDSSFNRGNRRFDRSGFRGERTFNNRNDKGRPFFRDNSRPRRDRNLDGNTNSRPQNVDFGPRRPRDNDRKNKWGNKFNFEEKSFSNFPKNKNFNKKDWKEN